MANYRQTGDMSLSGSTWPLRRFSLFFGLFLAACGGGDTGGGGGPGPPVDFATYVSQTAALNSTWNGTPASDPSGLPISGAATYAGVMSLTVETGSGDLDMMGALALSANFTANSISGDATGFVTENATALSGGLTISGGVIDRSANTALEYTYTAILAGNLSGGGETFGIDSDMSGDFLGPDHLAASGIVSGTANSSFGTGYVFGTFIAAQ